MLAQAQEAANHADPHRWQLNMAPGVTPTSHAAYDAHMIVLWICVVIGVLVFGAMAVAIFKFRKSKGAVPDTSFVHSTKLEAVWTTIPILILIGLAFPATSGLLRMYDVRDLLNATVQLRDGKKITDMNLGFKEKIALREALKKV